MRYQIEYGKKILSLDIPAKRVVGTLTPRSVKPVSDVQAAVRKSLQRPFQSPPLATLLKGKKSALIVTVNHTRPSPRELILPVLDQCEQENLSVTVIIAHGRHRRMSAKEIRTHLGARIVNACRILQHDPFNARRMVHKGVTRLGTPIRVNGEIFKHDIVMGVGIIEPSYLCGFSGGRKLLLPGLAHHQSIDNNHFYLTHPDTRIGRLKGNPLSDDAEEFARKLPLHFIVYAICGPHDEFTRIIAGHTFKAHRHACNLCKPMYSVRKKQADIIIASPGPAPYDCNLVQGKKAIIPALDAVRRNGVIIMCAECRDGLGAEPTFIEWLRNKTPLEVVRDVRDRKQFSLGAHGANILAHSIAQKNAKVILVTCPKVARQLKGTYLTTVTKLEDAWQLANLLTGTQSSVLFIKNARRLIMT